MIKRYHWALQRGWNNWVLPSRYGVLLTFLRLNITRITLWNKFSGLCIKFRNKTWHKIRYLGQNITNLQNPTFDANVTPGMRKKRHIISPGSQTELQDISSSKKPWINVFSGPKTSKMPLSSWDTGVQKINERKSQNSILSLLRAFFIVRNYNQFQKWIEISCITDFDIFPTNFASLSYSPECPGTGWYLVSIGQCGLTYDNTGLVLSRTGWYMIILAQ